MIAPCLSMISKRFADYQSADSRMQQARQKNKIREEFVYALHSLMFDYAFVHCAWSHTHDMMQMDLNPCFATRQNHEARNSSVKHCSGPPTHHIMRMIFCARHDADGFESMLCNQTEPWSKKFICETLLWLATHDIMRMIFCARHDAHGFESMRCNQTEPWSKRFICETLLWLATHDIMRMIFCARHDAHGFESMRCNQTEPWSKRFICETLLWLLAHHIMRMISFARHDAGGFLIASCTGVVGWSHCRTWRMQRFTYLWISAVFECMTHCSSYRAH